MFSAPNKILTVEYWYQIFQFPGLEKFVNFLHFRSPDDVRRPVFGQLVKRKSGDVRRRRSHTARGARPAARAQPSGDK
ncbi:hypothetical protein EVAR_66327_1 [Eumeta japonica]|uniref:Uncharacterized protein n=1 Tax=Eumeta variegata TaxID=151549 RepID=A0A4C1YZ83_EUMVA|nr:hypothetical protein EVAR_66327_1 [Eumeta japonica]